MDHQLGLFDTEHNQLEQIAASVGTNDEVPRRVVAQLNPGERVLVSVDDVVVGDVVAARRAVDVRTG